MTELEQWLYFLSCLSIVANQIHTHLRLCRLEEMGTDAKK